MLPPVYRLKKEKEIKRSLFGKQGVKSGMLACRVAANNLTLPRFCFVVSKRVSGKAVVRNKVKRRLRASVAVLLPRVSPGFDCVIIAFSGLETKSYAKIAEQMEEVLAKAGVLKSKFKAKS